MAHESLARYPWWKRKVWVELSATAPLPAGGPFADPFVWVARKVGVDHVLFGGDYPLDEPARAVRAVAAMGCGTAELRRIFFDYGVELISPTGRSA